MLEVTLLTALIHLLCTLEPVRGESVLKEEVMTVISHEDLQNIEFQEAQGWEQIIYDYQIPIALIALVALFVFR